METDGDVLYIGHNQDHSCFALGLKRGFAIWDADPLKLRFARDFEGGIGIVEQLYRTNIIALVGGGPKPQFPPNHVIIWDDHRNIKIADIECSSDVKGVRMTRERIVVALETKVYIYQFNDLRLLDSIATVPNPKGILAVASEDGCVVVACPGVPGKPGSVTLKTYLLKANRSETREIAAHTSAIGQVALSRNGSRLATTSVGGTVIYVWDTSSKTMVANLTRGTMRVTIHALAFNEDASRLAATSETGTVHIFLINSASPETEAASGWGIMSLVGYGSTKPTAQRSISQFRIEACRSLAIFGNNAMRVSSSLLENAGEENIVIAGSTDGQYYRYLYETKGGAEAKEDFRRSFISQ